MPADLFVDPAQGMVFSKAWGDFVWADGGDHVKRLKSDPHFRPEFNQRLDFRDVTRVNMTRNELQEVGQMTVFGRNSKRACVVSNDVQFGIARMLATHREIAGENNIRVFRDIKPALEWLSLDAEPERRLFRRLQASSG